MRRFYTHLLAFAVIAIASFGSVKADTWSVNWNKIVRESVDGFYNFGSSAVQKDTLSTVICGLNWSITSVGTYSYSMTSGGQCIGQSATNATSHTSLFTYDMPGSIEAIRIKARRNNKSDGAELKVSVNGTAYLCEEAESVSLTEDSLLYEFKPVADALSGKLDIELFQKGVNKGILYIKSIAVDYKMGNDIDTLLNVPVISLPAGTYDSAQVCTLSVADYEAGTYSIYYTLDGSSPKSAETAKLYTEPFLITATSTLKAITKKDNTYSKISEAKYVVRVSPNFKFEQDTLEVEAPDNVYSPYPNYVHYVNPIDFYSSNPEVCIASKSGYLYTIQPGTAIISACYAGNETYLPDTASYVLVVKAKKPLEKPVLDPMGGTFDAPVEVSVKVDDERAMAIWYSVTANDSAELTDEPQIIKATEGVIKIKKSCKLLVLAAGENVFSPLVEAEYTINEKTTALFVADEAFAPYYTQGFDSIEEIRGWELLDNNATTFMLQPEPTLEPYTSFSTIDPNNQYSLNIRYATSKQQEMFLSPAMYVRPGSKLEFYSFFSGVWLVYANWYVGIYNPETGKEIDLVNGFQWAQENAYTGPAWIRFSVDLSEYADQNWQFYYYYEGTYGDDVAFDGMKLLAPDTSDQAQITISVGDSIHFHDTSIEADAWYWSFPGGTVLNDDPQNPVVAYEQAGTYDVQLIVTKQGETPDTLTRKDYVVVKAEMPKAMIGVPAEGYLSPYTYSFVPTHVPVTFQNLSTGHATEYLWHFEGADIKTSTEANPVVTYIEEGQFGVGLHATNEVGTDADSLINAIQAGGTQQIWNITPEESQELETILINSWYGYYGGSNWLDIYKFAEKFEAPAAPATIDSIAVYFGSISTITPDTSIVVEVFAADTTGLPGELLASGSVKAGELAGDEENILPTWFKLDKTVSLSGAFFVSVSGMPNNADMAGQDDVAILCLTRPEGEMGTAYHYLSAYDEDYNLTDSCYWTLNEDPVSMAICPSLTYATATSICLPGTKAAADGQARKLMLNNKLYIKKGSHLYNVLGIESK